MKYCLTPRCQLILLIYTRPKQLLYCNLHTAIIADASLDFHNVLQQHYKVKSKGSSYSITEHRVLELIPVLGSQPASDVSHKPGGRLPLLCARPVVTPKTVKRAATSFVATLCRRMKLATVCVIHSQIKR